MAARFPGGLTGILYDRLARSDVIVSQAEWDTLSSPLPELISLLVRRPGLPPLLMICDVSYDAHLLEAGRVPGVGNRRQLRQTTAMINQMRQRYPDLAILLAGGTARRS